MGNSLKVASAFININFIVVQNVRAYCISHSDTSTFFESLHAAGIEVQKLTTFLWYCIDSGLQSNRTKVSLEKALAASSLYLALTSIKSAKLYRLYDISLFQVNQYILIHSLIFQF